jgi:prophage antirepressor-like protein
MSNDFNLELTIPDELCPGSMKIRLAGTPDEPLFYLADVCAVLELGNASQVATRIDDDEKGICLTDTPGGITWRNRGWPGWAAR